ncbi:hypothetical protein RHMOL_Rhmol11G0110700 [Rhododendron molle]|uniref:Uncharacterized protein n=1 Tax=Rhododendron molle TaxID=49168 RepID=A0ACC0LQZ9_RHOML|nr:hypothetical protein RHMOL_Rhmol11G0110700 [Rhododendron molle]
MLTFENLFVNSFVLYQVSFLQVSLLKLRDLKDRKFMGQQGEHKGQVPVLECQAISGLNCYLCALLFVYQMLTFENLFVKSFVLYQVAFLQASLLKFRDFEDRKVMGTTKRAFRCRLYKLVC